MRDFFERLLRTVIFIVLLAVLIVYGAPVAENHYYTLNDSSSDSKSADWMKKLDDGLLLSSISVPGTHDSATQYVELPFFANCQAYSISEQLNKGYRYLDIRLGAETDKEGNTALKLMHGFTSCKTDVWPWATNLYLDDVLSSCYDFLSLHKTETILFVVKQEYGDESVSEFQKILNSYIQKNPSKWLLTDSIPTLKEARGKIVLFRRYEDEAKLGEKAGISLQWKDQGGRSDEDMSFELSEVNKSALFVQDHYEYGNNLKWSAFYYGLSNPADGEKGEVFVNFLSTKGTLPQGHPFYHAYVLNKKFVDTQFDPERNYGWVVLDFATEQMAASVYNTNFK